jgi:hypothetical protein
MAKRDGCHCEATSSRQARVKTATVKLQTPRQDLKASVATATVKLQVSKAPLRCKFRGRDASVVTTATKKV